jgi:hypothetical protein
MQIEHRRKGLACKHRILARVVHGQPVTFQRATVANSPIGLLVTAAMVKVWS